jgi:hypothetical protein
MQHAPVYAHWFSVNAPAFSVNKGFFSVHEHGVLVDAHFVPYYLSPGDSRNRRTRGYMGKIAQKRELWAKNIRGACERKQ